jgi:hypothetical protein
MGFFLSGVSSLYANPIKACFALPKCIPLVFHFHLVRGFTLWITPLELSLLIEIRCFDQLRPGRKA